MTNDDVGIFREVNVGGNFHTVGRTGRPAYFQANVHVAMGGYFNASKSQVDLMAVGGVTGLLSAHCMELKLPTTVQPAGHLTVGEFELVTRASTTVNSNISFMWFQVSGDNTATADFLTKGYLFEMTGFGAGTDGDLFSAGTAENMTGSIRINIDGVGVRYLMVCTNAATA